MAGVRRLGRLFGRRFFTNCQEEGPLQPLFTNCREVGFSEIHIHDPAWIGFRKLRSAIYSDLRRRGDHNILCLCIKMRNPGNWRFSATRSETGFRLVRGEVLEIGQRRKACFGMVMRNASRAIWRSPPQASSNQTGPFGSSKPFSGVVEGGERPLAFFAGEDGAPGALYARGVYVLGVVLDVHEYHLLRHPVQDVLGGLGARGAGPVLAT